MPFAEELKTSFEIKELQYKATQTLESANTDKTFSRKKTFKEDNFELKQRTSGGSEAKYDCFFEVGLVGFPEKLSFIGIVASKYFYTNDCGEKEPGIAIVNTMACKKEVVACTKSDAPDECWSKIVTNTNCLLVILKGDFAAAATELQPIMSSTLGGSISILVHPRMIEKLGEEITVSVTYGYANKHLPPKPKKASPPSP